MCIGGGQAGNQRPGCLDDALIDSKGQVRDIKTGRSTLFMSCDVIGMTAFPSN
jgi:hypothetical protein